MRGGRAPAFLPLKTEQFFFVLLDSRQHDLAILLQLPARVLQRFAVLLDSRQHDLVVLTSFSSCSLAYCSMRPFCLIASSTISRSSLSSLLAYCTYAKRR